MTVQLIAEVMFLHIYSETAMRHPPLSKPLSRITEDLVSNLTACK
jgi:hypothetical protein